MPQTPRIAYSITTENIGLGDTNLYFTQAPPPGFHTSWRPRNVSVAELQTWSPAAIASLYRQLRVEAQERAIRSWWEFCEQRISYWGALVERIEREQIEV